MDPSYAHDFSSVMLQCNVISQPSYVITLLLKSYCRNRKFPIFFKSHGGAILGNDRVTFIPRKDPSSKTNFLLPGPHQWLPSMTASREMLSSPRSTGRGRTASSSTAPRQGPAPFKGRRFRLLVDR